MDEMLEELLQSRRSIRRFKPDKPSRQQLEKLIEMAVTAPSASNKQPWRFFITEDRTAIDNMAQAVQAAVDRIAGHIDDRFAAGFRAYSHHFLCFRDAPVVIVAVFREVVVLSNLVGATLSSNDLACIKTMESQSGLMSVSMAVENLLLYAHHEGLGATCMTGPVLASDEIKDGLGIPKPWAIAAVIPVGFPDEAPEPTPRKPVSSVLRHVTAPGPGKMNERTR
jgi:nitroreductase